MEKMKKKDKGEIPIQIKVISVMAVFQKALDKWLGSEYHFYLILLTQTN